jgi:myo-inositol-1(or 4)-monophosphatase
LTPPFNGDAIHVSKTSQLHAAIVAIGDYAVGPNSLERNTVRLALTKRLSESVQRVRMHGSTALDLSWVAHGLLDAMVMLSNKPWDTAAGVAIARAADASVLDVDGSQHTATSRATIAAAPHVIDELLALTRG